MGSFVLCVHDESEMNIDWNDHPFSGIYYDAPRAWNLTYTRHRIGFACWCENVDFSKKPYGRVQKYVATLQSDEYKFFRLHDSGSTYETGVWEHPFYIEEKRVYRVNYGPRPDE